MVEGFAACVDTLNVTEDDKFSSDATELLLTTQYMDLLDAVAEDARTRGNERPGTQTQNSVDGARAVERSRAGGL